MVRKFWVTFLARLTVSASGALHEGPLFIANADGETVELRLCGITDRSGLGQTLANAPVEIPYFLLAERIVQRQHGDPVLDRAERGHGRRPDPLGGRIGREQVGMLGFDGGQLHHEPVILGVRHFRIIECVVAVAVSIQKLAQSGRSSGHLALGLACLPCRTHGRRTRPRPPGRATRTETAPHPRAASLCAAARTVCPWRPARSRKDRGASSRAVDDYNASTACSGSMGPGNTANMLTPRNSSSAIRATSKVPGSIRLATKKMLCPSACLR